MGGDGVKTDHTKRWWESLTIGAAIVFGGVEAAERVEVVPTGTAKLVADLLQILAGVGTIIGARRAIGTQQPIE